MSDRADAHFEHAVSIGCLRHVLFQRTVTRVCRQLDHRLAAAHDRDALIDDFFDDVSADFAFVQFHVLNLLCIFFSFTITLYRLRQRTGSVMLMIFFISHCLKASHSV